MGKAPLAAQSSKADSVRAVRRTASAILLGLVLVFLATFVPETPATWVLFIRAMSEAGMVGGLADWFAVEALFRRPLRLPIPHTALLPRNQKRAAKNIARFIDEYFLVPEQLVAQIRKIDPVMKVSVWLSDRDNARMVGKEMAWAISMLVHSQFRRGIPGPVKEVITQAMQHAATTGRLSDQIIEFMESAVDTELLDAVLQHVRNEIDENRKSITRLVQDRSRWWISSGVDRQVAVMLVEGVLSVLDELSDPTSPRREAFSASVVAILQKFREEGSVTKFLQEELADYESSEAFSRAMDEMLRSALEEIDDQITEHPEELADVSAKAIQNIARRLRRDAASREILASRIENTLVPVLDAIREPVRGYVAQTISDWDSDELVKRIEGEVGRDLQFIRINGALLGAILGGMLFSVEIFLR